MLPLEGQISYTPIAFYSQEMTLFYLLDFIAKKKKANKILKGIKIGGGCSENKFFLSLTT